MKVSERKSDLSEKLEQEGEEESQKDKQISLDGEKTQIKESDNKDVQNQMEIN